MRFLGSNVNFSNVSVREEEMGEGAGRTVRVRKSIALGEALG